MGANISGRYFDKDNNQFNVNNFHLALEKPEKDWGVGFKVSGDFGRYGELLHEATQWNKTGARLCCASSAELREAYLTTTIPVGEGIGVKGGLFTTLLGTEILNNPGRTTTIFLVLSRLTLVCHCAIWACCSAIRFTKRSRPL